MSVWGCMHACIRTYAICIIAYRVCCMFLSVGEKELTERRDIVDTTNEQWIFLRVKEFSGRKDAGDKQAKEFSGDKQVKEFSADKQAIGFSCQRNRSNKQVKEICLSNYRLNETPLMDANHAVFV